MKDQDSMDRARQAALEQIGKHEKVRMRWFVAAGIYEGLLLVAFVVLADFSNEDHVLLFFAACLVYGTLAFGMFALYAHINVCTQRILRALDD